MIAVLIGTAALGVAVGAVAIWFFQPFRRAQTLSERVALLAPYVETRLPDGDGPAPAVIFLFGCAGLWGRDGRKEIVDDYARDARDAGFASIIVDSHQPRGLDFDAALAAVCTGRRFRGAERAGDVAAAIAIARDDPAIDSDWLALAGWSHGGWAIMETQVRDPARIARGLRLDAPFSLRGVRGLHLTYPYCGWPARAPWARWRHPAVVRFVVAERDRTADNAGVFRAARQALRSGYDVSVRGCAGLTHGFDEADQIATSSYVYDPAAAKQARRDFAQWLTAMARRRRVEIKER